MGTLCIEGWRDINHSFSLLNQWQLLQFIESNLNLYHRDIPLYSDSWNRKANGSGLNKKQQDQISSIPSPSLKDKFDVIYRISFPFNIADGNADRIFVFGAPNLGHCKGKIIGGSPSEACKRGNLKIITCSCWSKMGFLNSGFPEDKVKVIPLGVNPYCFYPIQKHTRNKLRQSFGFKEDDFILLNVGALTGNKGVEFLINAFFELKESYPKIKLIIKDSSTLYNIKFEDLIKKLVADKRQQINVNFLSDIFNVSENLNIANMNYLYNISDAYISPYIAEGFNLPPLEAAACGTPILVTDGGATEEYFSEKIGLKISSEKKISANGDMFTLPDFNSLKSGIKELITSKESFDFKLCSSYVHKNFNWDLTCESLIREFGLYKDL